MAESNIKLSEATKTKTSRSNKAVQGTNDSSVKSKWSAACRGYFLDDYLTDICQSEVLQNGRSSCVRAPIINRGYWIRFHAVNHVLTSFLDFYGRSNVETQVISLGAGYDSTFFRLTSLGLTRSSCYIEVDFPELLRKKLELIRRSERLSKFLPSLDKWSPSDGNSSTIVYDSTNYKLIGGNLNSDLQPFSDVLLSVGVDFTKPTLLLSEVVLVYLNTESSSNVIRWAAERFQDAVFVTYEQVYPEDAFGTFMCRHFKNIGTGLKSVAEYPTVSSQVHRYCSLGWTESVASDMNYFFHNVVPPSERLRVDSTELFDEYEEWHLKCAHYVLVTALNGICTSLRDIVWRHSTTNAPILTDSLHRDETPVRTIAIESDGLLAYSSGNCDPTLSEPTLTPPPQIKAECVGSQMEKMWNRVYGHACVQLNVCEEVVVLITGGFGSTGAEGAHRRLGCASLVQVGQYLEQTKVDGKSFEPTTVQGQSFKPATVQSQSFEPATVQNQSFGPTRVELFESMYHTLTLVNSEESVMFGGRTSPAKSSSDVFLLRTMKSDDGLNQVTWKKVETSGGGPCARWRHSAAFTTHEGSPVIVVFGGRSCDQRFLDDCWMLNCVTWRWEEIHGTGEPPCARHTHTSDVWKSKVVIICGLGCEQTALDSIHLLNMTTYVWCKLTLVGERFIPRYSHTSTVHNDRLILVGGVSLSHAFSPIAVIDLTSGTTLNFDLKIPLEAEPTMLHNHGCIRLQEEEEEEEEDGRKRIRLLVIGGGGNCFSFGTHLNEFPLVLTV